jgi:peptidoglycan/xylan/chitin deacetylase (PgdA/CDA1 family)
MVDVIVIIATILALAAPTPQKRMAVTVDDLPFQYSADVTPAQESTCFRKVLAVLNKHNVKAIGFVIGNQIKPHHKVLLDEFIAAGNVVGNHTFSHDALNSTDALQFEKDIDRCQKAIAPWVSKNRFFRYPYLQEGDTEAKQTAIANYLAKHGLQVMPVTIVTHDWNYSGAYDSLMKAHLISAADSVAADYRAQAKESTIHFDSIATAKAGRPIEHVLLIHMSQLNADCLDSLLTWYSSQGWQFVSAKEALADSAYRLH